VTAPTGASPVVVTPASAEEKDQRDHQENQHDATRWDKGLSDCPAGLLEAAVSNRTDLKTIRTLLVWRAIGGDLHDVRVVLGEPRIDTHRVCLCTSVADRGVMRGRDGVRGVGNDADLVLTHRGGMRDEDVSRLHV